MPENPTEKIHLLLKRGFRYALSLTHDRAQAEDVLQDAWVSVLRANGPREQAYLFSAIRSRFFDQVRRARLVPIESLDAGNGHAEPSTAPTDEFIFADAHMIEQALGTLRPVEREVLLLFDVEGYTAREIAVLTGCPRNTVLSLVRRSREKLKKHLLSKHGKTGYG